MSLTAQRIFLKQSKKVLDTAEELGYIPNLVARNLKKRKTNTIGIIVPDVMNSYYSEMIKYNERISGAKLFYIYLQYNA